MKAQAIFVQMLVIVAIGTGIGFAHSKIKPVVITREAPPKIGDVLKNAGVAPPAPKPAEGAAPAEGTKTPEPNGDAELAALTQPAPTDATPKTPDAATNVEPKAGDEEEQLSQALRDKGHITIKEAKALFEKTPPAYFVDTRHKADYEEGHVKDAFSLPLAAFSGKKPKLLDVMDPTEIVVVYCVGGTCEESEEVAKNLSIMGHKNVYVMHAGFPGWVKAGLPVNKGVGIQE